MMPPWMGIGVGDTSSAQRYPNCSARSRIRIFSTLDPGRDG
jgi:hypothetical protein